MTEGCGENGINTGGREGGVSLRRKPPQHPPHSSTTTSSMGKILWLLLLHIYSTLAATHRREAEAHLQHKLGSWGGLENLGTGFQVHKRQQYFKHSEHNIPITECMTVSHSEDGEFSYVSDGEAEVCGLYLVGRPDQKIEITLEAAKLTDNCKDELIVIVDGWELNGNIIPSEDDHSLPLNSRFEEVCEKSIRRVKLVSNQNAAMVQFKIPVAGDGFKVSVKYVENDDTCNVLMSEMTGVFKIANNGQERNCSVTTLLFPATISLLEVNVGAKMRKRWPMQRMRREFDGIEAQCSGEGEKDFLELGGAEDLTSSKLDTKSTICGYEPQPASKDLTILCGSSTVRLVSSGAFKNTVKVLVKAATLEDLDTADSIVMTCPHFTK